ncbi:MAG: hypothetical protein V3U71_05385 [Cocleimonas sp.]
MAKIAPPKKNKTLKKNVVNKDSTEKINKAIEQTPPNSVKPTLFNLPEIVKNDFKAVASLRGMTMTALFLEMFEEYKKSN